MRVDQQIYEQRMYERMKASMPEAKHFVTK